MKKILQLSILAALLSTGCHDDAYCPQWTSPFGLGDSYTWGTYSTTPTPTSGAGYSTQTSTSVDYSTPKLYGMAQYGSTSWETMTPQTVKKHSAEVPSSSSPGCPFGFNRFHPDSLANPFGAGSPYKPDGLMNPYSKYGSKFSNKSWQNPYATDAPKLYDSDGNYLGRFSTNRFDPDSISNPLGKYGSSCSIYSINNPLGAGNPLRLKPIYVVPSTE